MTGPEDVARQHSAMTVAQRRRLLLLEYHCTAGCLLLRVWTTSRGPAFHRPAYVLTPERNEGRSNEDGRTSNTSDGRNHWRENSGIWFTITPDLAERFGWGLHCRHVDVTVRAADVQADIDAGRPGSPVRRSIRRVSSADPGLVPLDSVAQS